MNEYIWESLARGVAQGSIALLAVWAICLIFSSAPAWAKCWLWRLAWLRVVFASAAPLALNLRVLPAEEPLALTREETIPAPMTVNASSVFIAASPVAKDFDWKNLALSIWALGVAAGLARLGLQWTAARRLRDGVESENAASLLAETSQRRGMTPPRLVMSDRVSRPLLVGVWRPTIILPPSAADMPAARLELIFRHELAHVKRHDLLWNWLPALSQVALWFNPLVWLAGREYSLAQEMACDEMAVEHDPANAPAFAAALVELASNARRPDQTSPLLTASVIRSSNTLERRLKSMKTIHSNKRRNALAIALLLIVATPALLPWRIVAQKAEAPADASGSPAAAANEDPDIPGEKEILAQQMKIARHRFEGAQRKREQGLGSMEEVILAQRGVLRLEQDAALSSGDTAKYRESLRTEIKLLQELQKEADAKIKVGVIHPDEKLALDQEALALMLKLKRQPPATEANSYSRQMGAVSRRAASPPGRNPSPAANPYEGSSNPKSFSRRDLVARREGPITELKIKPGQKVEAGQTLVVLNEEEGLVRVRIAESQFRVAKTNFELRKLEIQKTLKEEFGSKDVDKDYATRKSDLDLQRAEGELELMSQQLEQARLEFQKNYVRAPVDGVIEHVYAAKGSEVPPGGVVATILVED